MSRPCPKCGKWTLHRSHSRNVVERAFRATLPVRPYRCTSCSYRGWLSKAHGKSKAPFIKTFVFYTIVLLIALWVSFSLWNNIK